MQIVNGKQGADKQFFGNNQVAKVSAAESLVTAASFVNWQTVFGILFIHHVESAAHCHCTVVAGKSGEHNRRYQHRAKQLQSGSGVPTPIR